jgi:hypothetical protein
MGEAADFKGLTRPTFKPQVWGFSFRTTPPALSPGRGRLTLRLVLGWTRPAVLEHLSPNLIECPSPNNQRQSDHPVGEDDRGPQKCDCLKHREPVSGLLVLGLELLDECSELWRGWESRRPRP